MNYYEVTVTPRTLVGSGTFSVFSPSLEEKTDWQRTESFDSVLSSNYWQVFKEDMDSLEYDDGELNFIYRDASNREDPGYRDTYLLYARTLPMNEDWQVVLDDVHAATDLTEFGILIDIDSVTDAYMYLYNQNDMEIRNRQSLFIGDYLKMSLNFKTLVEINNLTISIDILNNKNELISHLSNEDCGKYFSKINQDEEKNIQIITDKIMFIPGTYSLSIWFGINHSDSLYKIENLAVFKVEKGKLSKRRCKLPSHSKTYLHSKWI